MQSSAKRQKSGHAGTGTECKWSYGRKSRRGNGDAATTRETADTQLQEFHEGQLGDINEGSGCDKKDEDVPEEGTSAETAR